MKRFYARMKSNRTSVNVSICYLLFSEVLPKLSVVFLKRPQMENNACFCIQSKSKARINLNFHCLLSEHGQHCVCLCVRALSIPVFEGG